MEIKDSDIVSDIGEKVLDDFLAKIKPADMVIRDTYKSGAIYGFHVGRKYGQREERLNKTLLPIISVASGLSVGMVLGLLSIFMGVY